MMVRAARPPPSDGADAPARVGRTVSHSSVDVEFPGEDAGNLFRVPDGHGYDVMAGREFGGGVGHAVCPG